MDFLEELKMQQMFEKKLEKHSHDDHSAMKDKFMI